MSSDTPPAAGAHSGNGFLRSRSPHAHSKVTFIELFFDLVFVFAVTQLSHLLMHHFSPAGALQTLLLMLAVWWVWIYTSWVTNWLDPERVPVRFLLLSIMLAGVVMSSALPMAFESRAVAFAFAYTTIQVGRTAFFLRAVKGHVGMVRIFNVSLPGSFLGGVLDLRSFCGSRCAAGALGAGACPGLCFAIPGLLGSGTRAVNDERLGCRRRSFGGTVRPFCDHRPR